MLQEKQGRGVMLKESGVGELFQYTWIYTWIYTLWQQIVLIIALVIANSTVVFC